MNIEDVRREIDELSTLAAQWQKDGAFTLIEQEVALLKLARLYEGVKFVTFDESGKSIFSIDLDGVSLVDNVATAVEDEMPESVKVVPESEVETEAAPEVISFEEETDIVAEVEVKEEVPIVEPELKPEPEAEPKPEPEYAPKDENGDNMLFDIDIIPKQQRRSRRSVLMSLYNDDMESVARTAEPKQEPIEQAKPAAVQPSESEVVHEDVADEVAEQLPVEVAAEPTVEASSIVIGDLNTPVHILADNFVDNVETVADRLAADMPRRLGDEQFVCHSFAEMGISERYLLTRELFGDDPQLCNEVLTTLNTFDNYEDAMIYIAENFNWSGEGEGAKLLLSILEYKFNII